MGLCCRMGRAGQHSCRKCGNRCRHQRRFWANCVRRWVLHLCSGSKKCCRFRFTSNRAFNTVIENCKQVNTQKHNGSWINNDIIEAYTILHTLGHAHSAEAWQDGVLVGGLYGIRLGNIFFGESMFSKVSNASKFAFIHYVQQLQKNGVVLIDCQQATAHLQSLGATLMERGDFIKALDENCS